MKKFFLFLDFISPKSPGATMCSCSVKRLFLNIFQYPLPESLFSCVFCSVFKSAFFMERLGNYF